MPSNVSKTVNKKKTGKKVKPTVSATATPAPTHTQQSTKVTTKAATNTEPTSSKTKPITQVQLTETLKCLEQMSQSIVDLTTQVRALGKQCNLIQREYTKEQKQWQKLAQKKKKNGGAKHQSGIAKPSYISPELCKFIGKDVGTEIARTEVIRLVADYIKKHKLQDEEKRKVIVPNKELASLLYNPQNEEITFFNLQKMMAAHYKNPNKETSANLTV